MANCSKCEVELLPTNTLHGHSGIVRWCDGCWRKFWFPESEIGRKEERATNSGYGRKARE